EAIPREKKPDDPLYMDIWNGFYKGAGEVVGDIIGTVAEIPKMAYMIGYKGAEFADHLVSSPSPKAYLYSSVHKGIDTAKYMCQSVKNAFERDVVNGNAESRTEFFTHGIGTIGISLFGDKGLSKLGTPAKAVAEEPEKSAGNLRGNIGVAPAFEAAGTGHVKIPYNMMNELGVRLQHATKERWSGDKPGIFNSGTFEHIFRGEVNKKRKAVGYHHESMMGGKIVEVTDPPNQYGVYRAIVEIEGKNKKVPSTFFPKDWNRVQVTEAIKEAYNNKKLIKDNLYEGTLKSGMKIQMRIDPQGKIKTAYPLY
ncbi:EndoU domain-containing protein, partial [Heyndrickxia coagulans]